MDRAAIVEGRRGSRMLLELALAVADPREPGAYPDLREPAGAVARALERSARAALTEHALAEALISSVEAAMYWQAPSYEDDLACSPEVRRVLEPLAALLVAHPATAWWSEPVALGLQYEVRWSARGAPPVRDPRPVSEAVAAWSATARAVEERAEREWPSDPSVSFGSEWWSTPVFSAPATTRWVKEFGGPAALRLVEDGLGWDDGEVTRVHPNPDVDVLEIGDADDWAELCRRHPLEVTAWKRHDWYRTTGRDGRWIMPDWTSVATEHDGVHLTVDAYLASAGMPIPVEPGTASVIAGWAPDTTYWLTDRHIRAAPIPWTRSPDGPWGPA